MLVLSWIVVGALVGVIGHLILREHGYDLFGEVLVGISAASVAGALGPLLLGVRTGSVDVISDVGLLCTVLGAALAVGLLVVLTPRLYGHD
jgi:uncharacterized membrane protein YeaQ/YmgE (transglycosylase-associated protein family)